MPKNRQEAKGGSSTPHGNLEEPKMDIKSILKDIEFLGSSHMTWKQKKDLENREVVSLGGKPTKKQRLPLSVARVTMKKQKETEEKLLQENAILRRFGGYNIGGAKKAAEGQRRPEDRILRSTEVISEMASSMSNIYYSPLTLESLMTTAGMLPVKGRKRKVVKMVMVRERVVVGNITKHT